ncbi:MAG: protein-disulfide reductase DsbD family protein [Candidatus Aminicenantes bacterium]|nr:protein-disulfide reductase DsbD family protein [Candidatus Aminicenantes bacterium]
MQKKNLRLRLSQAVFIFILVSLIFSPFSFSDAPKLIDKDGRIYQLAEGMAQEKGTSPVKAEIFWLGNSSPDLIQIGIYFQIQPGWYLYWLNPGEAGLPPQVNWELPAGFKELKLEFPLPSKFYSSGYLVYGYKEELLLLSQISTPKNFSIPATQPTILKAKIDWMVCRESCQIGKEELSLDLSLIKLEQKRKAEILLKRFKEKFPKSAEEINVFLKEAKIINFEENNLFKEVLISLRLEGKDIHQIVDFYPLPIDNFIIEAEKTKYKSGLIELYLKPTLNEAKIEKIKGLLVAVNSCYSVEFSLNEASILEKI